MTKFFATILALFTLDASGHHAFPESFNTSQSIEIRGQILALAWMNPHVSFSVLADDGRVWQIETNSISRLESDGIRQPRLAPGTAVHIAGFPARNGEPSIHATHIEIGDDIEIVLRPGSKRRWR